MGKLTGQGYSTNTLETWKEKVQQVFVDAFGNDFVTAMLIDMAGLKGYKIGGAQISIKHAGFIVNTGDATAQDVIDLTEYIKSEILNKFGKTIELEIQVVGE